MRTDEAAAALPPQAQRAGLRERPRVPRGPWVLFSRPQVSAPHIPAQHPPTMAQLGLDMAECADPESTAINPSSAHLVLILQV